MVSSDSIPSLRAADRVVRVAIVAAALIAAYHAVQLTNPEFTVSSRQLQQDAPAPAGSSASAGTDLAPAAEEDQSSRWEQNYRQTLIGERSQGKSGLWRMVAIAAVLVGSDFLVRRRLREAVGPAAAPAPDGR